LNEFFKQKKMGDDLRAHDFVAEIAIMPFLSRGEEQSINKYLAHITTTGSNIGAKAWILDDMVIRGLTSGAEFLSLIEMRWPVRNDRLLQEIRGVRDGAYLVIKRIGKRAGS
jgi:hypothetical protein